MSHVKTVPCRSPGYKPYHIKVLKLKLPVCIGSLRYNFTVDSCWISRTCSRYFHDVMCNHFSIRLTDMIQTLANNDLLPSLCFSRIPVRSKDFGSPNARNRCYIVGVRCDVGDEEDLERLCRWVRLCCTKAHTRASLGECFLSWVNVSCCWVSEWVWMECSVNYII